MIARPTRRQAALSMLAPAAAAAQQTPPPADELEAARRQTQRSVDQLRAFKVPAATEPSFAFRP